MRPAAQQNGQTAKQALRYLLLALHLTEELHWLHPLYLLTKTQQFIFNSL